MRCRRLGAWVGPRLPGYQSDEGCSKAYWNVENNIDSGEVLETNG